MRFSQNTCIKCLHHRNSYEKYLASRVQDTLVAYLGEYLVCIAEGALLLVGQKHLFNVIIIVSEFRKRQV